MELLGFVFGTAAQVSCWWYFALGGVLCVGFADLFFVVFLVGSRR